MNPKAFLKKSQELLENLNKAQTLSVAVGLPREKVGGEIYGDGTTILEVGASHEYGIGLPVRSWLRMPLAFKVKDLDSTITSQFKDVFDGKTRVEKGLNLVGAKARNIILEAFRTSGWGTWPDITQETKDLKGSSKILIDTGTLRNSVTWVVR